jgi:hypothetical protein
MQNFLQQFQSLLLSKPRYNLKASNAQNCEYADTAVNSQNCYYTFGAFHSEDLYYSRYSRNCKNSSDLTFCFDSEWCYECIGCSKCHGCSYSKYLSNCSDCYFCEDSTGLKDCFGCIGMHQKQYCFFNQQLTKEEYEKRLQEFKKYINTCDKVERDSPLPKGDVRGTRTEGSRHEAETRGTRTERSSTRREPRQRDGKGSSWQEAIKSKLSELRLSLPQIATHQTQCEDSTGDNLVQTKNAFQCFDAYDLEDCSYCIETNSLKDCSDMTVCFKTENSYQCLHCPGDYNCNFCIHCDYCSDSEFCAYSMNLKDCFGCVYLKDKQYHILNKSYSKEDYERITTEIKTDLAQKGMYNLLPFFNSDYEQIRLSTETDPAIAA